VRVFRSFRTAFLKASRRKYFVQTIVWRIE
jgi:hypothetical protein